MMSRKVLVFIFFLILSAFFWTILSLNETQEKEIVVPVVLTNIPTNVVITSETIDSVRITVRDKGYILGTYIYGQRLRPIGINFNQYATNDGHCQIPTADLQRMMYQQLYGSSRITAIKPDKLDFYFNHGAHKKLPVRFQGKVATEENYFITQTHIRPDSVTIYASSEQLEKLHYVYIEPFNMENVSDTVRAKAKVECSTGMKSVPPTVDIELIPDVLTEKSIEVSITCINLPEGKILRTFPSKAIVRFVVGASQYRAITPEGFTVVTDYNDLINNTDEKCHLQLQSTPSGVSRAKLVFDNVDYIIEQL